MPVAYSAASERNKGPILEVLTGAFRDCREVLEIGSGTGQHAVHFARSLSHLNWQPTDLAENIPDLMERVAREGPPNLRTPIALDVRQHPWPVAGVDAAFTANTFHIMDWEGIGHFFQGIGAVLEAAGVLCVYGPFRYAGRFTTESNAAFDLDLKARDPASGIRDFEAVNELAQGQGLTLLADHALPANNQALVWVRLGEKASSGPDA